MAIFQTGITIASGLIFLSSFFAKNNRISLFPECYFWWLAGNRSVRDGLANMNVSPKQKRKDGAYQGLFFLWEQQFLIASFSNETILCSSGSTHRLRF